MGRRGGVIEQHDAMTGNSYTNWGKVNPAHYALINYITHKAPCHVIVNFRAKMKYAMQKPKRAGARKPPLPAWARARSCGPAPSTISPDARMRPRHLSGRGHHQARSMLPDMRPVELTVELGDQLGAWAESGVVPPRTLR